MTRYLFRFTPWLLLLLLALAACSSDSTPQASPGTTNPPQPPQPPEESYNIEIRPVGNGFTPTQEAAFTQAAAAWGGYITEDLTDIPAGQQVSASSACGYDDTTLAAEIDDLLIYAVIEPDDGPGGVLARAGPAAFRTENAPSGAGLPAVGCLKFDVADVARLEVNGEFDEVVLHEMGHVIGVGTIWQDKGVLSFERNTCLTSRSPKFIGTGAVTEYAQLGGSGDVPVEMEGGRGTACGHWSEKVFGNELMTGFLNSGNVNPFSRMTVASLDDLGYTVDLSRAAPYDLPNCSPDCRSLQSQSLAVREVLLKPTYTIAPDGTLSPITQDTQE